MKFQVYTDKSGEYRWRLVSANGRTVADSGEGYTRRDNAIRAIGRIALSRRVGIYLSGKWPRPKVYNGEKK